MTDETLFEAALEKLSSAERAAFLDEACANDPAMRQRVEALLEAHKKAGDYLEQPALEQMGAGAAPVPDATAALDPAGGPEPAGARTEPGGDEIDDALDFLQPSTRPDSLGRLGHYEVLKVLGHGGFGIVLKAFDERLHRVVAVKVMAPRLAATSPARKRFLREARASAAIRHDNVVAIHNVEEQPIPYLVMEFIAGETLQQKLDRVGPLDASEVVRIGRQIAEGLAAAHAQGLIHRDVKPANILLEGGVDRVKITDFGLARAADDASLTQSGVIAGTPMYMAPEQALGEALDHRADLFSLGSVLYAITSGRPPFRAPTALAVLKRVTEDAPRPIREIIPEAPEWLCAIIAKLHAKKPQDRFASAKEVADLLAMHQESEQPRERLESSPVGSRPRSPGRSIAAAAPAGFGARPGSGWIRRRTRFLLLVATLLAITAGGAVYLVWFPPWATPLEKRLLGTWEGHGSGSWSTDPDVAPNPVGVPVKERPGWALDYTATVWATFEPDGTYVWVQHEVFTDGSEGTISVPENGSSPPHWKVVHAQGNTLTVRIFGQERGCNFQGKDFFTMDMSGPWSSGIITFRRSGAP